MKKLFPGYYRPTEKEFSDLWNNCIFVFDANVLLNLYRYSLETREELLGILKDNADRLWLPHQAALEYHRSRLVVIQKTASAYEDIQNLLKDSLKKIENDLHSLVGKGRHPFVNETYFIEKITNFFTEIQTELDKLSQSHPDLIEDDPIQKAITDLFQDRVGSPYLTEQLTKIYQEGKDRYEKKIPPGYLDSEKDESKKYGDLILWHQIIDYAKVQKRPIILVTDDRKDDWWKKIKGQTIGPQPELIQEIVIETGILFYMYSADPFMEKAHDYLKRDINQKAVDEVREYREREEKYLNIVQNSLYSEATRTPITSFPYPEGLGAAFTGSEALRAAMTGLPTSEALRAAMTGLPTSEALRAAMAGFPTSEALRAAMTGLPTSEALRVAMAGFPTSEALRAAMAGFPTSEALRAAMAGFPTSEALRAAMAGFPTLEALSAAMTGSTYSESVRAAREGVVAAVPRTTNKDLPPASETISDSNKQEKEHLPVNTQNAEIASKPLTLKPKSKKRMPGDSGNL